MDLDKIKEGVKLILEGIGEDPARPGLIETPRRVAEMFKEIFSGLEKDPSEIMKVLQGDFYEEMILIKEIPFYSMCEHHLIPFSGKACVAYIPAEGRIVGLSKLSRVLEIFAKRPQLQERLTSQFADHIMHSLRPLGAMVVVEAEHLCMSMRGIKKPGAVAVTSAVRGIFKTNESTRQELLELIRSKSR